jgi:hypothetical protein
MTTRTEETVVAEAQGLLKSTDMAAVRAGLSLADELAALCPAETDERARLLRSSLLSQLARLQVQQGQTDDGYRLFHALLKYDLSRPIWDTNLDKPPRDRHLGPCVDEACPGFLDWVGALPREQDSEVPEEATPLAAATVPIEAGAALDKLWMLIAGRRNYAVLNEYHADTFAPGRAARLAVLLRAGAEPQARYDGNQALRYVCVLGDTAAAKFLLANGADINDAGKNGTTALMAVAERKRAPELIRFMVEAGANVDAVSKNGRTALFNAAYSGSGESIATLVSLGADPNAATPDGLTAIEMAARSDNKKTAEALLECGATPTLGAVKEAQRHMYFAMVAILRRALEAREPGSGGAPDDLATIAEKLGKAAARSADDSGDFYEYQREDEEGAAALIAEQYWEAQYEGFAKEAIDVAPPEHIAGRGEEEILAEIQATFLKIVVQELN